RSAFTQQPLPGRLRLRSGTTEPSGPATKRIISSAEPLSRVTIQVLSFTSCFSALTRPTINRPLLHYKTAAVPVSLLPCEAKNRPVYLFFCISGISEMCSSRAKAPPQHQTPDQTRIKLPSRIGAKAQCGPTSSGSGFLVGSDVVAFRLLFAFGCRQFLFGDPACLQTRSQHHLFRIDARNIERRQHTAMGD